MDRNLVARAISIVGHPFVTVTVMMLATAGAAPSVLTFLLITMVPVAIVMVVQVRRGKWEHVDASNRGERKLLYVVGIAAIVAAFAYHAVTHPNAPYTRGVLVTLGMLAVFALLSRWVKVSLHMAFAAISATVLLLARSPAGWFVAALVPALLWSRLRLRRHTPAEVVLGLVGGVAAGLLIYFL